MTGKTGKGGTWAARRIALVDLPDREANEPLFYKSLPDKILAVLLPGPAATKAEDKALTIRRAVE